MAFFLGNNGSVINDYSLKEEFPRKQVGLQGLGLEQSSIMSIIKVFFSTSLKVFTANEILIGLRHVLHEVVLKHFINPMQIYTRVRLKGGLQGMHGFLVLV